MFTSDRDVESFKVATITLLSNTEYLHHQSPRICSVCYKHNLVLSSFMTYHRGCNKSNTTGATIGTGTAYPSEHLSSQQV